MIRFREDSARPAAPTAVRPWPKPTLHAHDPLSGPGREADPVAAMKHDISEIVACRGCVEEMDLKQRGWTTAEILEHMPDALAGFRTQPDEVLA